MDLIHATYLFFLGLGLLRISLLRFCLKPGLAVTMETVKSQHRQDLLAFTKKKEREKEKEKKVKSKINPFYYQIIPAILFGFSIVLPYRSGIYGVPSMCLNIKTSKCLEGF